MLAEASPEIIDGMLREARSHLQNARLADALSRFNVRSKNRRKNFATMVKIPTSSND